VGVGVFFCQMLINKLNGIFDRMRSRGAGGGFFILTIRGNTRNEKDLLSQNVIFLKN